MRLGLVLVCLLLVSLTAFGQVGNGTITGVITDPAGAVVPGAAVEAKNAETGVVYTAVSTASGNYAISDLPVGSYVVTVKVQGFKTFTHSNLALGAAQTLPENVSLQVGNATEAVTVTAEATLLKTETGDLASNVTIADLDSLPMIGTGTVNAGTSGYRNPYNTLLTIPGVSSYASSGTFVLNGLPAVSLTETMRVEGQDSTSRLFGTYDYTQMAQPSVDAVQEIAYQTSNYAAEFGQAGQAVINMTMKSGTNQYHGTGYDYFVNEDLNSGQPYSQSGGCISGTTSAIVCSTTGGDGGKFRPRARRNDFVGTLGGPISIPKIYNGKNKTFFFFNYEEFLETNVYGFQDTVPTANYLQGNFSQISPNGTCSSCAQLGVQTTALGAPTVQVDPGGNHVFANEIFDPLTRTQATSGPLAGQGYALPFQNNTIPLTRFDPVSVKVLGFVPAATNAALFAGNYIVTEPGQRYSAIPAFKIDHNISSKDKLSFYYSENTTANQFNPTLGQMDGFPNTITEARGSFITNYQERLNYDRTLTPTLLLHIGAGLYHQSFVDNSPTTNFNPQQSLGLSGFLENRTFPEFQGNCTASFTSGACSNATGGLANLGPPGQGPSYEMRPTGSVNVTWVKGKHTFKAGAEMIYEQAYSKPHPEVTLNSGTAATGDPFTNTNSYGAFSPGFGFASFLLGDYSSVSQSVQTDTRVASFDWAFFLQDSWKVTRKLSVDYGIRYDYDTPAKEQYGRWGQLDPTLANPVAGNHPGALQFASNCGCQFYQSAYPWAIGPRLGIAYQINPKTVFRGGWGVNYQFISANAGGTVSSPGTYNLQANSPSYIPGASQFVNAQVPGGPVQTPHWPITNPFQFPNPGATSPAPTAPDSQQNRPPRINQWSAGFQREITRNFIMEATYVGNHAVWIGGGLGELSQLSPQRLATYGLYPIPGTGPTGHNNLNDRALLSDPISSTAVTQFLATQGISNILPYAGFPTSSTLAAALYPFPQFGNLAVSGSPTGGSFYNSLQMKATKRLSHNFQAGGAFTWAQGFTIAGRPDFFNPQSAVNQLQNIPPLDLTFNATYTVPKAQFLNKWENQITQGWQLGWFSNYQSGVFLAPPVSTVNTNYLPSEDIRVAGQPLYNVSNINDIHSYNPFYTQVLNPNAWAPCPSNANCAAAAPGIFGTSAVVYYKDFRAPRTPAENANIGRNFKIGKEGRMNLQIRGEFVNIFNRTLLPAPGTSNPQAPVTRNALGIQTGGFGVINTYVAPNISQPLPTQANQPILESRQGTLIARFSF